MVKLLDCYAVIDMKQGNTSEVAYHQKCLIVPGSRTELGADLPAFLQNAVQRALNRALSHLQKNAEDFIPYQY